MYDPEYASLDCISEPVVSNWLGCVDVADHRAGCRLGCQGNNRRRVLRSFDLAELHGRVVQGDERVVLVRPGVIASIHHFSPTKISMIEKCTKHEAMSVTCVTVTTSSCQPRNVVVDADVEVFWNVSCWDYKALFELRLDYGSRRRGSEDAARSQQEHGQGAGIILNSCECERSVR